MYLYGVDVEKEDCKTLIWRLLDEGHAEAAAVIGYGLSAKANLIGLSAEQRDMIMQVLDDPPPGLVELREALVIDLRERLLQYARR